MNLTATTLSSLLVGSLALASALPAQAAHGNSNGKKGQDWAKVTHVQPVTETRTVRTPVETCREVAVRNHRRHDDRSYRDHSYRNDNHNTQFRPVAALVGSVIGGAIGHQFGGGNGKKALTAAGALIGASIANQAANADRGYSNSHSSNAGRRVYCETSYDVDHVREVVGYDVTYRYRGHEFTRRMDEHPGKRVPVQVDVRPVNDDYSYVAFNSRRHGYQM